MSKLKALITTGGLPGTMGEFRELDPIVRTCGCGCDRDHCFFCMAEFDPTPTKREPLKGSITHLADCLWLKLQG